MLCGAILSYPLFDVERTMKRIPISGDGRSDGNNEMEGLPEPSVVDIAENG